MPKIDVAGVLEWANPPIGFTAGLTQFGVNTSKDGSKVG
jgi:hypothetical protein